MHGVEWINAGGGAEWLIGIGAATRLELFIRHRSPAVWNRNYPAAQRGIGLDNGPDAPVHRDDGDPLASDQPLHGEILRMYECWIKRHAPPNRGAEVVPAGVHRSNERERQPLRAIRPRGGLVVQHFVVGS